MPVHSSEVTAFSGNGHHHKIDKHSPKDKDGKPILVIDCPDCEADAKKLGWFGPTDEPVPATFEQKRVLESQKEDANSNILGGLAELGKSMPDLAGVLKAL